MKEQKYVTEKLFKREIKKIHSRFKSSGSTFKSMDSRFKSVDSRFKNIDLTFKSIDCRFVEMDQKFNRMALSLIKTQEDVEEIKRTIATQMMTKDEFNQAFDQMSRKLDLFLNNTDIHRGYIHDHEVRIVALEKHINS